MSCPNSRDEVVEDNADGLTLEVGSCGPVSTPFFAHEGVKAIVDTPIEI